MATVWRVRFDLIVADEWIDDGFALTPAILTEIIQDGILQYAYESEKRVENISIVELGKRKPKTHLEG